MNNYDYTPDYIQELAPNEIFVFGSNKEGQHAGGAARTALRHFGAIWGMGEGLQGQSYALPSMGGLDALGEAVERFVDYARQSPDKSFLVTQIGCGIAGYTPEDVAPLFRSALGVSNIVLPRQFADILEVEKPREKYYLNHIKGCLVGGAAGDALGYAVEFMRMDDIVEEYGADGIQHFRINEGDVALISDDTQMTLFTACGMLSAVGGTREQMLESIKRAYLEWYGTQAGRDASEPTEFFLTTLPVMNHRRAPGTTCMSALHDILHGQEVDNFSKGCGGIMRTAPIALMGVTMGMDIDDVCWLAAESARLTHKHPLGYLPSLIGAYIVYYSVLDAEQPTTADFRRWIDESFVVARRLYGNDCPSGIQAMKTKMDECLATTDDTTLSDREAVRRIGEGWVGEEALCIAVCSVLRHFDDFAAALRMSVNHDGDSDSTGCIAGQMMGALIGYSDIPAEFKHRLEGEALLLDVAGKINKMHNA